MPTHILLIDCPDETGLVHRITGALYRRGGNIISNNEFVDRDTSHFFMRTEFSGEVDADGMLRELCKNLPQTATIRLADNVPRRIVVLATTEPHCLGDLLVRHEFGELNSQILAVISNHQTLRALVERFDIPFHYIDHAGIDRAAHEAAMLREIGRYVPEHIVLAKYMRILTPEFVAQYPQRIINIHHSFLPAFAGAGPYRQAFEARRENHRSHRPLRHEWSRHRADHRAGRHRSGPRTLGGRYDPRRARRSKNRTCPGAAAGVRRAPVFLSGNRTVIFE